MEEYIRHINALRYAAGRSPTIARAMDPVNRYHGNQLHIRGLTIQHLAHVIIYVLSQHFSTPLWHKRVLLEGGSHDLLGAHTRAENATTDINGPPKSPGTPVIQRV